MSILVVTKLLFGNYMLFMPIYHIKKFPSKIIYLGYSVNIIRSFWPEPDPDYKRSL